MDLPSSVAPFILRGVTLSGVDSVMAPRAARIEAWGRLAQDLDVATLDAITTTHPLADAPAIAPEMLAGRVRGRVALTVELLSPARRPIQTTNDLAGFWTGSWSEVRKDMRSRYPKHSWPEHPQSG